MKKAGRAGFVLQLICKEHFKKINILLDSGIYCLLMPR